MCPALCIGSFFNSGHISAPSPPRLAGEVAPVFLSHLAKIRSIGISRG